MYCLDFVQGLHSFVACFCGARFLRWSYVYSMRKSTIFHQLWSQNAGNGILEAHMLNFSRGSMPPDLHRGSHLRRSWARLCLAKSHLLLVVRAGISETGILKIWFKILLYRLVNYSTTNSSGPRGGPFSAISCPAWWGICHFLRAIKTNPHLYPGVG